MMQDADLRRDDDRAGTDTRRPAVRGVFVQAEMCAAPMVVGEIRAKHAAEMPVVEDDHVVQTLAANGPITRCTYGFCHGLSGLDTTSVMPRLAIRRRT